MESEKRSLTTVERAFEILQLLWELDGAGPTQVADRLNIPDSTAHDYLQTLSKTKYVTAERGEYSVSSYFLTMGGKFRHRNQLFQVAIDEMQRAAQATDELVGLTIEDAGSAVILHQELGTRALNLGTYIGAATPLHTNASGKVILAYLPEDRVAEILDRDALEQRTEHTITDPDELHAQLEIIREDEYAVDWDEQVVGMGMAAVPITVNNQILGSVCIVAPSGRIKHRSYQRELLRNLEEIRQTVEINYQYGRRS